MLNVPFQSTIHHAYVKIQGGKYVQHVMSNHYYNICLSALPNSPIITQPTIKYSCTSMGNHMKHHTVTYETPIAYILTSLTLVNIPSPILASTFKCMCTYIQPYLPHPLRICVLTITNHHVSMHVYFYHTCASFTYARKSSVSLKVFIVGSHLSNTCTSREGKICTFKYQYYYTH